MGGEAIVRFNLKLPEGASAAGAFIIAVVDFYDDVSERNEANNIAVSPSVSSLLIARVANSDPENLARTGGAVRIGGISCRNAK